MTQNQSWPSCSDSSGSWRAIVRPTAWRPGSSSADNSKSRETRQRQWECFYSLLRSAPLKAGEGDAAEGAGGAASKPGRVQEFVPSPEGQRGDGGSSNAAGPEGPAGRGAGPRETVSPRTERRGRFTRTFTGRTSAPIFIYICIYVCVCVRPDHRPGAEVGKDEETGGQWSGHQKVRGAENQEGHTDPGVQTGPGLS